MKEKINQSLRPTTATSWIKTKSLEATQFKELIKKDYPRNFTKAINEKLKNKQLLFRPKGEPTFFGTFVDNYIYYKIHPKKYVNFLPTDVKVRHFFDAKIENDFKNDPLYKIINRGLFNIPKKRTFKSIFEDLKNNKNVIECFFWITIAIIFYRSGDSILQEEIKERLEIFKQDFEDFDKLIEKQINKYKLDKKKLKFNPVFGQDKYLMTADGDLVIDNKLVEIKCSIKFQFGIEYMYQLILYWSLNQGLDSPHNLSNKFIYWNPFYDIFETFEIKQEHLEKYFKLFEKLRNVTNQ